MKTKSLQLQLKQPWTYTLGLDFGYANLKYVLLKRKGGKVVIVKFGKISSGHQVEDSPEARINLVKRFLSKNKSFGKPKIILGMDSPEVHVKKESFPPLSKKDLQQTIQFDMEREVLKEIGGGEIVFDFTYVGLDEENAGNKEYMTLGAPVHSVIETLEPLINEELLPAKITSQLITMSTLIRHNAVLNTKIAGILDVGSKRSLFAIYKHGVLDFYREIPVGGDDFTQTITGTIFHEGRAIQFTTDEAIQFKKEYGYPLGFTEGMTFRGAPLSEIGAMMRPMVERLTGEIHRSIDFYKEKASENELEEMLLMGGGARLKHLPEMLTEKVNLPVRTLSAPKNIKVMGGNVVKDSFVKHFLEHAVSLSLALEVSDEGSLLPKNYRKMNRSGIFEQITRYAALVLIAGMIVTTMLIQGQVSSLNYRLKTLRMETSNAGNRAQAYKMLQTQKDVIEKKILSIDQKLLKDDTSIELLKLFSHIIPDYLTIVNLSFGKEIRGSSNSPNRDPDPADKLPIRVIRVQGMSMEPPVDVRVYLGDLMMAMKKSGFFEDVALIREAYESENNKYEFDLVAPLAGGM